jgi:hypothetical protein
MDSYQFYKSFYDRELNRRKDLDSAINLPLTILSIIVAANSYIIKAKSITEHSCQEKIQNLLLILIFIGVGVSIFFLTRSYNNLFKGFAYRNLGLTSEIRKYEHVDLVNYNTQVGEKDKLVFENIIIDKLTSITDNHTIFNDKRSHDLYLAKTFMIISIMLTALNFLIIAFKYIKI